MISQGEGTGGESIRWFDDRTVTHVRQQDDLDVPDRVDHRDRSGPPGVAEGGGARPAVEVVVLVRAPSQTIGGVVIVRNEDLSQDVGTEALPTVIDALVGHQLQQHPKVVRGGEQSGMSGDPGHGVEGLLVLDLAPTPSRYG